MYDQSPEGQTIFRGFLYDKNDKTTVYFTFITLNLV